MPGNWIILGGLAVHSVSKQAPWITVPSMHLLEQDPQSQDMSILNLRTLVWHDSPNSSQNCSQLMLRFGAMATCKGDTVVVMGGNQPLDLPVAHTSFIENLFQLLRSQTASLCNVHRLHALQHCLSKLLCANS